ncbi:hypothetical protein WH297_14980 [Ochrobactrum vermis]|uniref:Uncharacterized protein n=1 Tax=Ochrobactrum vermis TaxID=1827297 RepID=A0ABU8PHG0_9HYPH|nr:hypothetical protein [Ochrobactrum vermis]
MIAMDYVMTKQRFRILILSYIATLVATAVDAVYFPAQVSKELAAAYAKEALPPFVFSPAVFLVLAAVSLAAIIIPPVSLFFFKKWGRWLGVCTTIVMLVGLPFLGPSLSSGFGTAVLQLSAALWGAVLALAYFSPISRDFH